MRENRPYFNHRNHDFSRDARTPLPPSGRSRNNPATPPVTRDLLVPSPQGAGQYSSTTGVIASAQIS